MGLEFPTFLYTMHCIGMHPPTFPQSKSPNHLKHSQPTPKLLSRPRHKQDNAHEREALLEISQEEEVSLSGDGVGGGGGSGGGDVGQGGDVVGAAAKELCPGLVGPEEFAAMFWAVILLLLLLLLLPREGGSGLGRKRRCCVCACFQAGNRAGFVGHLGDEAGVEA
jgi:hypothetical protein